MSKSQNIHVDESIKSPITKKMSTDRTIVNHKQVKEEIINKVNENDEFNENFTLTKQNKTKQNKTKQNKTKQKGSL